MAVVKLTFDGANNTAKMDAFLCAFLTNYDNGIVDGLGDNLSYTILNGRITFKSGYVSVYGRRLYIEEGTYVNIALDSTKNGYVVLNIDTANNQANITTLEASSGWPTLTKDNLLNGDGLYQLVLCAYQKTTSSITEYQGFSRDFIYTNKKKLADESGDIKFSLGVKYVLRSSLSGAVHKFNLSQVSYRNALIVFQINKSTVVTLIGIALGKNQSVGSVNYRYNGADYSLLHEVTGMDVLTLTTGSTLHTIKGIYLFY